MHIGVFLHTNDFPSLETGVTRYNKELLNILIEEFSEATITVYASPKNADHYRIFKENHGDFNIHMISVEALDGLFPKSGYSRQLMLPIFCMIRHTRLASLLWKYRLSVLLNNLADLDILLYTPYGLHQYIPSMVKCFFGIPVISAVHDIRHFLITKKLSFSESIYRYLTKCLLRDSDAVLIPSQFMIDELVARASLTKDKAIISYCVPSIPTFRYLDRTTEKNVINLEFKLPDRYLYFPSTIVNTKNHIRLIKALHLLNQQGCQVNLILSGTISDAELYMEINRLIKSYGLSQNIVHVGYITEQEKIALYKGAQALVMPTIGESFGLPIWEAFSVGCPVITSTSFDMNEQVADSALMVDPYSVEDIADKVSLIWTNNKVKDDYAMRGKDRFESIDGKKFGRDWVYSIMKIVKVKQ